MKKILITLMIVGLILTGCKTVTTDPSTGIVTEAYDAEATLAMAQIAFQAAVLFRDSAIMVLEQMQAAEVQASEAELAEQQAKVDAAIRAVEVLADQIERLKDLRDGIHEEAEEENIELPEVLELEEEEVITSANGRLEERLESGNLRTDPVE